MKDKGVIILILLVVASLYVNRPVSKTQSIRGPAGVDLNKIDMNAKTEYKMVYKYRGNTWTYAVKDKTWKEAFDEGAMKCFHHFNPTFIDEETGLEVIDTCANPRYQ